MVYQGVFGFQRGKDALFHACLPSFLSANFERIFNSLTAQANFSSFLAPKYAVLTAFTEIIKQREARKNGASDEAGEPK